jgi:predicted ArsR family transcriptional regulator
MTMGHPEDDAVGAVALLGDNNRRQLYELVADSAEPVGRDDAAAALGISRELAAFHLDRLVAGGLLDTEYRRRNGRTGPGAGRTAKLYRRAEREIAVSLPHRNYAAVAEVFASALSRLGGPSSEDAVATVARAEGTDIGVEARQGIGPDAGHDRLKIALIDLLGAAGYEPEIDPANGSVRLRNCPYRDLASSHRNLTCGMNHAWAEGVVTGLADPTLDAQLAPSPGHCCVVFEEAEVPAV